MTFIIKLWFRISHLHTVFSFSLLSVSLLSLGYSLWLKPTQVYTKAKRAQLHTTLGLKLGCCGKGVYVKHENKKSHFDSRAQQVVYIICLGLFFGCLFVCLPRSWD